MTIRRRRIGVILNDNDNWVSDNRLTTVELECENLIALARQATTQRILRITVKYEIDREYESS